NDNSIIEIFELLNDDKLFIVTQGKSYIIDSELQIKRTFLGNQFVSSALRTGPLSFLIGTRNGELLDYELVNNELLLKEKINVSPGHTILTMEEDARGNVWLGTENAGLSIYSIYNGAISNIKSSYKKPTSISNNSIWSLCRTRTGVMWMGPFKKGLSFYDPDYYKFKHIALDPFNPNSLSNNIVNCFSEDAIGNLWIGTDGGGLNYWQRDEGIFEHYSLDNGKLNSNVILSILPDNQNRLWLGSWANGITIFDTQTKDYEIWTSKNSFLASDNVMELIKDKKGRIWIATLYGGLQIYNPKTKSHENINLKSETDGKEVETVARLYEDDSNAIWVGTQTMGVFRLEEKDNAWSIQQYHSAGINNHLSNDYVNTITQDDYGNLWVGTQAGLNKYLPDKNSFKSVTKAHGLINDAIKGIVQDDYGLLWLSTEMGVVKYNEETNDFLNYDIYDGLQGNEFNASSFYKTNNYEIVFGGNNGFNIFTSKQAAKRTDKLPVLLSGLKIFNKSVYPNDDFGVLEQDIGQLDSITLSYKHSVFNIEFNALTLKAAEKVNYAYFLEGFEEDWNYVGNKTSANYTNINPGDYRLRIKSSNSDGIWSDEETSLFITITPPFWKTWWFRLLLLTIFIGSIYLVYYIRIKNIKRYQLKLERKIDERTTELRHQQTKLIKAADELSTKNEEIQRFTYAVSHDLKSPLSGIKGIAGLIPLEMVMEDFPDMEKYLEMINVSCDTMSTLIADITKIAKIGKIVNNNELLDTIEIIDLASNLVSGKIKLSNIKLSVAKNLPDIYGDKNRIIQVFGNLLDNAIKYMGDQKQPLIKVRALNLGDLVQFQVIDNGSGMDEKSLKKLFSPFERFHADVQGTGLGLYMIKQIIESHGGQITAESPGKGFGTTFSVTMPKADISMKNHNEMTTVEASVFE
ncbi:MAG: two-component regulator propeller domain-containing protein, partial [Maribacter sp.]